jgi:uncharacterized protein (TIGR01777 family)
MDKPKNVLITGASGLIGTRLTKLLTAKGYTVSHLGRSRKDGAVRSFVWDVDKKFIEDEALSGVDSVIHLAGAGVVDKRWTKARKAEILNSRIQSTQLLRTALEKNHTKVAAFISASAIGYYGFEDTAWIDEEHVPGKDFLADVTRQWEAEVNKVSEIGIRVVKLRIGIVFSKEGGALQSMVRPVKYFVGSPLGKGDQYISWVHIDDLCDMFIKALEDPAMKGAYNAVAPVPVTNKQLTKIIARKLNRILLMPPVPKFVLKLILGEMADIVVTGSKVSSEKIKAAGYQFRFADVNKALDDLL